MQSPTRTIYFAHLNSGISPVGNKYIFLFIHRDSRGSVELPIPLSRRAETEPERTFGIENLDAMVMEVGDDDVIRRVDCAKVRTGEMMLLVST